MLGEYCGNDKELMLAQKWVVSRAEVRKVIAERQAIEKITVLEEEVKKLVDAKSMVKETSIK